MRSRQVFSAASLSEVLKQLRIYRPSGLLTIQRVTGPRTEEAHITIERGQPALIVWNRQEHEASEALLAWLNSWGEIRFMFQSAEPLLQLPPPGQSEMSPAPAPPPEQPQRATWPPLSTNSGPLPAINRGGGPRHTMPLPVQRPGAQEALNGRPTPRFGDPPAAQPTVPLPPETAVPTLTSLGRDYAATSIPRHDRIVFLLINGRRTLGDLAQLTRRTPAEIHATLQRLQGQGLITLEQPPTNGHRA